MNLPEQIGRYQIESELGKGAMGVVYKAVDPNIGRTVALKTMRLDVHGIEEAEMLKRFKHEAVLAGVMNHANIITIYDAGDYEGVFYMAMEFMEGRTLQVVLHEQRVLPIEQVLQIAKQVCAGLDFAHQRGVIHRDIKPANIMLGADGTAKIMDFGIAKSGTSMTTAGQVLGTPTYMSPEQVRGRNLDGRSDLFSFGVCLYEMVTGEKPFTGQNITTIIYKIMNEEPIPPRELDVSIHPGISAIITRCLAKNVDERYQTGAELCHDLENYKSYGSTAPATKVMSAAAADSATAIASAKSAAMQSAHELEAVTTSHIPLEEVEEAPADYAKAEPANLITGTTSTVRRISGMPAAPPPPERKRLAGLVIAVLVVVLIGGGLVRWMSNRQPSISETSSATPPPPVAADSKPAQTAPAQPAEKTPPQTADTSESAKPTAAKPLPEKSSVPVSNVSATTGEARITSSPAGAKITIGGASQPRWITPFTAPRLQPGKYDVTVAKAGYVTQKKEITVEAGKTAAIAFDLVLAGGTVTVNSQPAGASIYLDGRLTGKATPATLDVDKGRHKVEVRKDGFGAESVNVDLSDGEKYSFAPILTAKNTVTRTEPAVAAKEEKKHGGFFGRIFGGGEKIPAGKGMVEINTTPPGAIVIQNGKASMVHTPIRVPMDPGKYNVTLQLDGYKPAQKTFNVTAGKTTGLNVTLEKK